MQQKSCDNVRRQKKTACFGGFTYAAEEASEAREPVTEEMAESTDDAALDAAEAASLVMVASVLWALLMTLPAESVAELTALAAEPVTEAMAELAADERIPRAPVSMALEAEALAEAAMPGRG